MARTITLDDVDPALRGPARRVLRAAGVPPWIVPLALRLRPAPRIPGLTTRTVPTTAQPVRVHRPRPGSGTALLWIHGGGYRLGAARQDDPICAMTATRLGVVVVAAEYRLAPRHPFPAALDDVHAAWGWLQRHASRLGVDPARVAIGGESAGGGLAAALVQRLHDEGARPLAQWLLAPMLDDRTAARPEPDGTHLVWDDAANRRGWRDYLGRAPGGAEPRAYAVPARRTDLAGLPPAFLAWGDIELFAAEDAAYAAALEAAGVAVTTDVVRGAPHGFENWAFPTAPAQALLERAQGWLAARLGVPVRA